MSRTHLFSSMRRVSAVCTAILAALSLTACISFPDHEPRDVMPLGQSSFDQYVTETTRWINEHRRFVTDNHQQELAYQAPFEIKPAKPNGKGVLMIHGFTDSPYNFADMARYLADQGFLVRAVVLPGHGTKPEDMLPVNFKDWDRLIDEQTRILANDVSEVYLAGFSTGANLALHEAYENTKVQGLILISPALSVRTSLVHFVPFANLFMDWLRTPEEAAGGTTPFRYRTAPLQALETFKDSMDSAMIRVSGAPYEKPVLVFMAEHDSIVNTQELLPLMQKQFTSSASRFVWYGDMLPEGTIASDRRLTVLTDYLPKYRIRSFSHLGLVYSPENPNYGVKAKDYFCLRGQDDRLLKMCHEGKHVWYGSWNENRDGHPYARLTFNPYFVRQMEIITEALGGSGR